MSATKYRIIFMGTPEFAVPSLQALIDGPDKVITVVCQPDKQSGRGRKLTSPPTKILAAEQNIPVLQPQSIRTETFLEQVRELAPDLIIVAAYGKILPGSLLHLPPLGTINVHGSLLPKYRGAAPIQWAVIKGERETGVTIMQMDEGMDTGDILLPASIPIHDDDTAGSVFTKLADLGGKTLVRAIELLKEGKLHPIRQDERQVSLAPLLSKEMGRIDWTKDAWSLHCLIRGLDPWPSAYGFFRQKRFRFYRPLVVAGNVTEQPGTLCRADREGLLVATGRDYLLIREIQPEGKKRMDVQSYLCGFTMNAGEQFT